MERNNPYNFVIYRYFAVLLLLTSLPPASQAGPVEDATETGRLLAILLDTGREAIARRQELINDASKSNKGFTSDVFERQVAEEFQQRTGIALTNLDAAEVPAMAKPLLARLMQESKKTIDTYQSVINVPGFAYKGLIPATFGTETATRFQSWSGIYMKQTAPSHLVRNPKNKPDDYESAAFARFAATPPADSPDQVLTEVTDDGKFVRVLLPLFYHRSCLACHGEPKGQRDISGYPKEGAKEGELGGAISVRLPPPSQ
jgi:general secretion pathway protein A